MRKINQYIIISLIFSSLICTGCASKRSQEEIKAIYYPQCHEPLAYLQERHGGGTARAAARGAITGGVISGIAGAIVGAITGGFRPVGILAGAGVGAALGGTVSAASQSSANNKEDNRRMAAYLEQIDGNIEGMDLVGASATVSRQCYDREFKQLMDNLGAMPKDAAEKRFREIAAGRDEAAILLKETPDNSALEQTFAKGVQKAYK